MRTAPDPQNGCGGCTLCCKLLGVLALDKPAGQWCRHCRIGDGCAIHASSPADCQAYVCLWRQMQDEGRPLDAELRPDRCHVIVDADKSRPIHHVRVMPMRADAWRAPAVQHLLAALLKAGSQLVLVNGEKLRTLRGVG